VLLYCRSQDNIHVVCATVAFGMGINKADVRFIFHYTLPRSMESYYQETGRAGRDGRDATCIIFFAMRDKVRVESMMYSDEFGSGASRGNQRAREFHQNRLNKLNQMVAYCENNVDCRRTQTLQHFGRSQIISTKQTLCSYCAAVVECSAQMANSHLLFYWYSVHFYSIELLCR
jgi:bloom syndrome protein